MAYSIVYIMREKLFCRFIDGIKKQPPVNRQAVNQLFTGGEYPSFAEQRCRQIYFILTLDFCKGRPRGGKGLA